jgi:hypothetical protein
MIELMKHQKEALRFLDNGKILYGGVGSGKSATAMAYYVEKESPRDIFVITTAKKRDSLDWVGEGAHYGIGTEMDATVGGVLTVDSWNNIGNYTDVTDAFFIFDEQRLVGTGAWVKSFLKIVKNNRWILLTATPGDIWLDYAPVFIANGWYANITDFKRQHVVYAPYVRFPKVVRYLATDKLERLRNNVLVEMPYLKHTERIVNFLDVDYDKDLLDVVVKRRWHVYEDRPIRDIAELFRLGRKVVNSDPSRLEAIKWLLNFHPRLIIFYNFNYELEILRSLNDERDLCVAEWNGSRKDALPVAPRWVYLVQYTAGAEGWNCTDTNAMVLYSLTYSYKNFVQAQGRIDRLNTQHQKLYYYVLGTSSFICRAVRESLDQKKNFNEYDYLKNLNTALIE